MGWSALLHKGQLAIINWKINPQVSCQDILHRKLRPRVKQFKRQQLSQLDSHAYQQFGRKCVQSRPDLNLIVEILQLHDLKPVKNSRRILLNCNGPKIIVTTLLVYVDTKFLLPKDARPLIQSHLSLSFNSLSCERYNVILIKI